MLRLEPSDYVEFRTVPGFRETQTISLEGEFVFPGVYAFDKGETLTSVIQRAGGFTDEAFAGGSVFLRESLREREQEEWTPNRNLTGRAASSKPKRSQR